jgi:hypothetical protein
MQTASMITIYYRMANNNPQKCLFITKFPILAYSPRESYLVLLGHISYSLLFRITMNVTY